MLGLETPCTPLAGIHIDFYCYSKVLFCVGGQFKLICKCNCFLRAYFFTPSTGYTAGKMKLHPAPTCIKINNFNGAWRTDIGATRTPHTLINIHLEFSSEALGGR